MEDTRKGSGSHPNEERRAVLPPSYETEREGQIAFYETFLPRVNPHLTLDDILADDNDGVLNGNLLEFKLRVSDLNAVLFQCVKYLSALRIKGMEMQNHMRTFTGSDGRFYRNELCLDTTNGPTAASGDIAGLVRGDTERSIIGQWDALLGAAKQTNEYDPALTYGVYQIYAEIDTSYKDDDGNTVWNNIEVHSALQTLKVLVRDYYNSEIVPTLFKYEFLK